MKNRFVNSLPALTLAVVFAHGVSISHAASVDFAGGQALDFGRWAVIDNNGNHIIKVEPDNDVYYDPKIIPDVVARRAEYVLTNFPPNTTIDVDIDNISGMTLNGGGGNAFTVDDFTTNTVTTDGFGDAILYVGATLTTSGNTSQYADGDYEGTYDITFNF